ncbi:hypothetical protein TWF506_002367 [Arthrobotrys conoides]|uniref:Uncharacterized protein n=1 Tax=Arthrobotrys conoides TaxID=74498 RepID=A0AAN8RSS9_9PEZI
MANQERVWKPAVEIPLDPQVRINELKSMLNDESICEEQKENIKAVIADMEAGLEIRPIYQDGKGMYLFEADASKIAWFEGGLMLPSSFLYSQQARILWLEVAAADEKIAPAMRWMSKKRVEKDPRKEREGAFCTTYSQRSSFIKQMDMNVPYNTVLTIRVVLGVWVGKDAVYTSTINFIE